MLSQEELKVSQMKMGKQKETLTEIHHWKAKVQSKKPPIIHFLSWIFGN
ncbi:hypothetical protein [Ammoniphilus oxalaticus]|nr:hypothetical protein [Ammoniphilus oxalaticus]